ncbi:MAG TPA: DUF6152 family protein [Gammaproteobacteria bacterium]
MLQTLRAALALATIFPALAFGHHSIFGVFDGNGATELEGVVSSISWRNPHVSFTLTAVGEGGESETWEIETTSLSNLRKFEIAPDFMRVGERVRVAGLPSVRGMNEIYARNVLLPSGEEVLLGAGIQPLWSDRTVAASERSRAASGDASSPELGIFRVWSSAGPMLLPETVNAAFDLFSYPLTARARAVVEGFDRLADTPIANCAPKGMPAIMEQPYPMEIVDEGNAIVLRIEEYDTIRTIHLADASDPSTVPASILGYSTGQWEGASLVVTTTRVNWGHFDTVGIPLTEAVEIVERFTPAADGSRLDYEMTVSDPNTFTEPVELSKYWLWLPQVMVEPYECL